VPEPAVRHADASVHDPRPPRHCYKCGREIGPDESICATCNRAGMATPSASQYHGTVAVAIIAAVAGLAIWASLAMRGVGPYAAHVESFAASPPNGIEVTIGVENEGTARGFAKCALQARDASGRVVGRSSIVAGPLEGGQSGTFSQRIPGLLDQPASVDVSCT
jgi:predicted nucleic acid-binding Zn ribbon protein